MINKLDEMVFVNVYYHGNNYFKFKVETLVIYMLRKFSTGRTHKDLADNEFGGCPGRWARGYKWVLSKFGREFGDSIGPAALCL